MYSHTAIAIIRNTNKLLLSILMLSSQNVNSLNVDYQSTHVQATPDLSHLNLPKSTLPLPAGLKLKHVALGVGTQNYSCTSATAEAIPDAIGAIASLLDIGPLLVSLSGPFLQNTIPPLALAM